MFHPRDATRPSLLTSIAHRLGLRRESHVIYLLLGASLLIGYLWYSTISVFGPPPAKTLVATIDHTPGSVTPREFLGVTTIFQSVPSPRGLVMLFHGCSHQAKDWFTLPEERRIVSRLLESHFSVIAFSSYDRQSGCWSDVYPDVIDNQDVRGVSKGLREYLKQEKRALEDTPLFAVGASSGGSFVTVLARHTPLHGGVLIVSPGVEHALTAPSTSQARPIPPLTFVYMSKDGWASKKTIESNIESMLQVHHIAKPIIYEVKEHPLTSTYLYERINITIEESQRFYEIAKMERFCDNQGIILQNPAHSNMLHDVAAIMDKEGIGHSLRELHASVVESLNVLWGEHEMTSEYAEKWVPWMETLADQASKSK